MEHADIHGGPDGDPVMLVGFGAPADALGLRYSTVGAGIGVVRSAIDEALGAGE